MGTGKPGTAHGALFHSLFERDASEIKVLASGFARVDGKWKFNSMLNWSWHNNEKSMHEEEIRVLKGALRLWELPGAKQDISVKECLSSL